MKKLTLILSLILLFTTNCFAQISIKPIVKDTGKQVYRTQLSETNDEVIIGDSKSASFVPQITFTKWNKENSLTIKIPSDLIASSAPVLSANKLEIKDSKTGFYFNPDPDNPDNFKFGLILYEKPTTNTWSFQLEGWEDFDFFKQPEWVNTEEFIRNGEVWVRNLNDPSRSSPLKAQGSYAIYHKTKKNNQYTTGKFGHYLRPRFIDTDGKEVWAELNIKDGIVTIIVPQEFLDRAKYPIKANDVFGNQGQGAFENAQLNDQPTVGGSFNLPVNATVSKITAYCDTNPTAPNNDLVGNIFTDSSSEPNVPQGNTQELEVTSEGAAWRDLTYGTSLSLNTGNYWLGIWGNSGDFYAIYYDVATAERRDYATGSGYTYPTWPNPWNTATDRSGDERLSIYATYTPSAAGATGTVMMVN